MPEWERFVRRLHDEGYKFIITGSNASLLSQELGTRLTGRSTKIEVFPFSFREFLTFKKVEIPDLKILTTKQKGQFLKLTNEYILTGGIPDTLKYPKLTIHKTLYDDVLYRDIATRYKLNDVKSLKELAFYLISNVSTLLSFNKIYEIDFFLPKKKIFLQVTQHLDTEEIRERETQALILSSKEQNGSKKLLIISERHKEIIKINSLNIQAIPLYEWLLKPMPFL